MPSNGRAIQYGDDLGLDAWIESEHEVALVMRQVGPASLTFEDAQFELLHNGRPVISGDATTVVNKLRKRRTRAPGEEAVMHRLDGSRRIIRFRDVAVT
jgi:hypothetical protein